MKRPLGLLTLGIIAGFAGAMTLNSSDFPLDAMLSERSDTLRRLR
ncbi:hypothetical protein [Paenibacillus timonensis]|nr:hypothetical protein [Paenibacillus timonensis]